MTHRLAALALFGAAVAMATGSAPALGAPKRAAKKHLLVVSYTQGWNVPGAQATFRHSSIPTGEKVLAEIGERSGVFDVAYCRTADDVKTMLTPAGLAKFDGVFFCNTTGNLGIPDLHAFIDWIKAGHAFFGAHAAGDTYHPGQVGGDTAYVDMLGAEFQTHHAQCEVDALNNDPKHPATKDLPKDWKILDEIYLFKTNPRPTSHMLLSMSKHPNDGSPEANQPGDFPNSWCRMYGKGRVFYTALGHREDVWENPIYQAHLLGAIKWGFGLAKGSSAPNNPAPKE